MNAPIWEGEKGLGSQARSWSLHTLFSSLLPSPRILSYLGMLFEMSFSYALCSTRKYSGTHCGKGMRVIHKLSWMGMMIVTTHVYWALIMCHIPGYSLTSLISFILPYSSINSSLSFWALKMREQRHLEIRDRVDGRMVTQIQAILVTPKWENRMI